MPCYLKFKPGVVVPKTVVIAAAAINAANQLGLQGDLTVTSGNDSTHMRGSKHYTDEALDFRTHLLPDGTKFAFRDAVKLRLGSNYDVLLEDYTGPNEHLHIEHQEHAPQRPGSTQA